MNDRERVICSRIKLVRESINWQQLPFAGQLGITRNQLAGIEAGATPVRYLVAWRLREAFGINLAFLAGEWSDPTAPDLDPWPDPSTLNNPRILLSNIWDSFSNDPSPKLIVANIIRDKEMPPHLPPPAAKTRAHHIGVLHDALVDAITEIEIRHVPKFAQDVYAAIYELVTALPCEKEKKASKNFNALTWELVKADVAKRFLRKAFSESNLTEAETSGKPIAVKAQLPGLLDDLKKATQEPGQKSALARKLGVPLASVSRWLSGEREPGGEVALQLRAWVDDWNRRPK